MICKTIQIFSITDLNPNAIQEGPKGPVRSPEEKVKGHS